MVNNSTIFIIKMNGLSNYYIQFKNSNPFVRRKPYFDQTALTINQMQDKESGSELSQRLD